MMSENRIAFLGPIGSYSEQAAKNYNPSANLVPYTSFRLIVEAVVNGKIGEGILPIENSLTGSVIENLEILVEFQDIKITGEVVIPIHHSLIVKTGTKIDQVKTVFSHPPALSQCKNFLSKNLPNASLIASLSTSASIADMINSNIISAAIANPNANSEKGIEILKTRIEDFPNNATRFIVISNSDNLQTGNDKTSLCISFDSDKAGILYNVLGECAKRGVNMTKIESRPSKINLGNYIFFIDIEGHREDKITNETLTAIESKTEKFLMLGSYPKAQYN